jgi:hypothetical protein
MLTPEEIKEISEKINPILKKPEKNLEWNRGEDE